MLNLARHAAAPALIAVGTLLAPATSRAAETPELTPAGAPLPTVKLADDPVDFDAVRDAWGRRLDFNALCQFSLPVKALNEAQAAKDFAKAYDLAAKWLESCPVDERVQMLAFGMAMQLNDQPRMEMHKRWYHGLVSSVLKSGDGKTPQTAWKTISVAEEYAVLQALELQRGSQALIRDPRVDELTARRADGTEVKLYFNPELHFARLNYNLSHK